ncbi:hypothetical protein Amsp01_016320 [Amycolatopsis sp. NBRC 101858]|uniref:hypothetical protein n=1 Tax=Amycolatopsis sp. NBRC 101858 TaxID=3032200 RepID=UPI0024A2A40B|nr:hypothetical protein [Amycolatopsis sp. NBRC 101858]GLY35608.1 hypothetical protein Amsp01_016320 [Amycolatopsis sp. NBRC 101858]
MLASLLPGFRDVRSALVAGYMWFCAGWLLIGHYRPPSAGLLAKPAVELLELFGTGGRLAAISVLCLLIGEVTGTLVQSAFFRLSLAYLRKLTSENLAHRPRGLLSAFRPLSGRAIGRVRGRIRHELRQRQESTTSEATPRGVDQHDVDRVTIGALTEVLYMSPRLIVAKPELYAEFSRIKGESEFRDAILLPLPVLAVAVCVNLSAPTWLEAVVLAATGFADIYLFVQSRKHFREAHSLIGHSIADGTISSASMDG